MKIQHKNGVKESSFTGHWTVIFSLESNWRPLKRATDSFYLDICLPVCPIVESKVVSRLNDLQAYQSPPGDRVHTILFVLCFGSSHTLVTGTIVKSSSTSSFSLLFTWAEHQHEVHCHCDVHLCKSLLICLCLLAFTFSLLLENSVGVFSDRLFFLCRLSWLTLTHCQ